MKQAMKIVRPLLLVAIGFSAGVAVAQYARHPRPAAPLDGGATASSGPAAPAGRAAGRDPGEDLRGQMMWDPNTRCYVGG